MQVLLVALLFSSLVFASNGKPCPLSLVGMTHLELQDTYMREIHLSDYTVSRPLWNATLYQPLQSYVQIVSEEVKQDSIHLVYVGVGPEAPLFATANSGATLPRRIHKLTLIDISENALSKAAATLRTKFPAMEIDTRVADITGGTAERFTRFLAEAVSRSASLEEVALKLTQGEVVLSVFRGPVVPHSIGSIQADIVYSEMVATFTGTAAMVAFESDLQRKFPFSPESERQFKAALKNAFECWQAYNDNVYLTQLEWMGGLTKPKGIVAVATDTEKKFVDPKEGSIYSFSTPSFPTISAAVNFRPLLLTKQLGEVMWEDSQHTLQDENLTRALLPHRHVIHFGTYRVER